MSKTPMQELLEFTRRQVQDARTAKEAVALSGISAVINQVYLEKEKQEIIEAYRTVPRQISGEDYYKNKYT